jgi:hypothetical protein
MLATVTQQVVSETPAGLYAVTETLRGTERSVHGFVHLPVAPAIARPEMQAVAVSILALHTTGGTPPLTDVAE